MFRVHILQQKNVTPFPFPRYRYAKYKDFCKVTLKSLKIGTPEIITIIVLQLEQLDFTVQYCVQKMQTE